MKINKTVPFCEVNKKDVFTFHDVSYLKLVRQSDRANAVNLKHALLAHFAGYELVEIETEVKLWEEIEPGTRVKRCDGSEYVVVILERGLALYSNETHKVRPCEYFEIEEFEIA